MTRIVVIPPTAPAVPAEESLETRPTWSAGELYFADGQIKRFGPDERFDADVPKSPQYDSQMPGGWAGGSVVLPRPPNLQADDAKLFSSYRAYDAYGTIYEGRVSGMPQVGSEEIRLEFEGHSAALDDDQTFTEIYVDQDFSHWQGPSVQRQINLITGGYSGLDPQVVADDTTGEPSLATSFTGPWEAASRPHVSAYYGGQHIALGSLYYAWKKGANVDAGSGDWNWEARLADDDVSTTIDSSGNLRAAGPGTGTVTATGTRFWAELAHFFGAAGGGDSTPYDLFWTCLAVYGTHGLTKAGTASATEAQGFYGSDILAHALDNYAPSLNYTLGDSIERSDIVIPHLVFLDRGTIRALVEQVTAIGGGAIVKDWGCYENQTFFHKTPRTYGRTWRVRKDQVATSTAEGPDSKNRVVSMMVTYRDGAGRTHSVGAPGSGAEYETAALLDTNPQNPAARVGRKGHESVGITNQEGAVAIGQMLMAEANQINWRGSMQIRGEATDTAGNKRPTSQIRAGDWIEAEDDDGLTIAQPINSVGWTGDDLMASLQIGATPRKIDVLLAQLAAATDLIA